MSGRPGVTRVGVTYGLAGCTGETEDRCGKDRPEQLYVNLLDEGPRPIQIEGWVGYGVDARMNVTLQQARELIPLLVEAVASKHDGLCDDGITVHAKLHAVIVEQARVEANRVVDSAMRQLEQAKR